MDNDNQKVRLQMKKQKWLLQFTLIELLVVVSIISLLMALLLPALKSGRDKATQINCLGNLRQLGIGILSYAQDYAEYLPTSVSSTGVWWCLPASPFSPYYANNRKTVVCPALKNEAFPSIYYPSWYGVNSNLIRILGASISSLRLGQIPAPASTLLLFCGHRQTNSTSDAELTGRILYVHNSGVDILFMDGHAKWEKSSVPENLWTIQK